MPTPTWTAVRSTDLVEAYETESLRDVLGRQSAIYMWKLTMRFPDIGMSDAAALVDAIDRLLRMPYGRIMRHRLSHFATIPQLDLRGSGLPNEKKAQLYGWASRRGANRKWLRSFIESLSQHAPALYVGETGNLRHRIRAHMSAETDFGLTIAKDQSLDWQLLDLYYLPVGPESDEDSNLRRALEYVTTVVSIGGFTTRPG